MGLWWKNTGGVMPEDETRRVSFAGDPEAMQKRWRPIIWRYHQNWQILRVGSRKSFRMNFESADGHLMRCRRLIRSEYVAVRVGPEPVTFWAISEASGEPLRIMAMNLMIPGLLRRDTRDMRHREEAAILERETVFI